MLASAMLGLALTQRPAPDVFQVAFDTADGQFLIEVHRDWAPLGAWRFFNLVRAGFYTDVKAFRAVDQFMVQFGISGDPAVSRLYANASILDDPRVQSNTRGSVSFASSGPNTRSTQIFINTVDNEYLDAMNFVPIGRVTAGMAVVDRLYTGYGEAPMAFNAEMLERGNAFLSERFPLLSTVRSASLIGVAPPPPLPHDVFLEASPSAAALRQAPKMPLELLEREHERQLDERQQGAASAARPAMPQQLAQQRMQSQASQQQKQSQYQPPAAAVRLDRATGAPLRSPTEHPEPPQQPQQPAFDRATGAPLKAAPLLPSQPSLPQASTAAATTLHSAQQRSGLAEAGDPNVLKAALEWGSLQAQKKRTQVRGTGLECPSALHIACAKPREGGWERDGKHAAHPPWHESQLPPAANAACDALFGVSFGGMAGSNDPTKPWRRTTAEAPRPFPLCTHNSSLLRTELGRCLLAPATCGFVIAPPTRAVLPRMIAASRA